MNKYDECLNWIKSGAPPLVIAMVAIVYYMTGMSAEDLDDIMQRIGMSYDTVTHTLTSGETTYSTYEMFCHVISNLYPNSVVISDAMMCTLLMLAEDNSCITSEQCTELGAMIK